MDWLPGAANGVANGSDTAKIALVNARSAVNKSFVLHDFFFNERLDFLYITKSWMGAGKLDLFSEILPQDCIYLNSPRMTARGRGVAILFKEKYSCKQLSFDSYSGFEVNAFELYFPASIFCALIYRPPQYDMDFIVNLSDFLSEVISKYNNVLILSDFNICPDKPLAKDVFNPLESLNLI